MKKIVALVLAGIMLVSMTACGSKNEKEQTDVKGENGKVVLEDVIGNGEKSQKVTKIENTVTPDMAFHDTIIPFYSDEEFVYLLKQPISEYIIVTYEDGTTENIALALENGNITIEDLDRYGIEYIKELNIELEIVEDGSEEDVDKEITETEPVDETESTEGEETEESVDEDLNEDSEAETEEETTESTEEPSVG